MKLRIVDVHARQILDSRGNPTVEAEVTVEKEVGGRQYTGRAAAPEDLRRWNCGMGKPCILASVRRRL